ncbi:unnamed protein product, partial [Didymodactylos carnosus]
DRAVAKQYKAEALNKRPKLLSTQPPQAGTSPYFDNNSNTTNHSTPSPSFRANPVTTNLLNVTTTTQTLRFIAPKRPPLQNVLKINNLVENIIPDQENIYIVSNEVTKVMRCVLWFDQFVKQTERNATTTNNHGKITTYQLIRFERDGESSSGEEEKENADGRKDKSTPNVVVTTAQQGPAAVLAVVTSTTSTAALNRLYFI